MLRNRIFALLGAVMVASGPAAAGERTLVEAILVRVNDQIVTISDFKDRVQQELSQQPNQPTGEDLQRFIGQLFEAMVDEMVLLERARERGVTIEDAEVDRAIDNLRVENGLEEEGAFEEAMAGAGIDVEGLRNRYRQSMLLQRTVQGEIQPSEITEEEVRRLYMEERERFKVPAKVELEQLFFNVAEDGSDREDVLRRVRGLVDRVTKGSDLTAEATLAGVEVQDLGAIPVEDLRQELLSALNGREDGELTEPIASGGGFQVIRLVGNIPEGYQPFEDVKEGLRRRLSASRYHEQTQGMVERLKEEFLVEVHRELLEQVFFGAGDA